MSSASSLMALQLFSRFFTFALNQALFRLASPSAFGAAAIQFELILSTILFLSREGVRNALLRVSAHADTNVKRTNMSFLPIIFGVPLALSTCLVYAHVASQEMQEQPYFNSAIAIYAVAALWELLCEPLYNKAMADLKTGIRVRAEGLGITSKSLTTFLLLVYNTSRAKGEDLALIAFAAGQLMYSMVMFLVYISHFGDQHMRLKRPSASSGTLLSYIDQELLLLSLSMSSQSLVKHFLTEGDKMILTWFSPLHDQGGYALAVNYGQPSTLLRLKYRQINHQSIGSLIARIVFQPIEETLRVFFSRILNNASKEIDSEEKTRSITQAASTLHSLLSIQASLSLIFVTFGSAYLPIFLPLLLPQQYMATSAPRILAAWIWYIPVLALNGGLEAFLSSVASPKDFNEQSRWMIGFSVIYILATICLYRLGLGDASLVYANIFNLSARITYCLHFVSTYFTNQGSQQRAFRWSDALPSWSLSITCALSSVLLRLSRKQFNAERLATDLGRSAILDKFVLLHVGFGVALAITCLGTWWKSSGRYLDLSVRRSKKE
ncbi:RTF domain-containing protein [Phlegmacium glaucopus]|nr:RTF domain-containing protein [Phlegmacium glaucopus]